MYQNLVNQNQLLHKFNEYTIKNPTIIPFNNNQLFQNNPHVMNNLNGLLQEHKTYSNNASKSARSSNKNSNLIDAILKTEKINKKNNKDVESNYTVRKTIQENAKKKEGIKIEITNVPYKTIIKDKIINKPVKEIKQEDLIVHKVLTGVDNNREIFEKELQTKVNEKNKINDELEIEFNIDNYDKHKKKFEYKETFIRNLPFEQNGFDKNKQDYIDFYKEKKKEAEEKNKFCDEVFEKLIDEGIISKDELPTDTGIPNQQIEMDKIMNNMQIDKTYDFDKVHETPIYKKPVVTSSAKKNSRLHVNKNKTNYVNV